MQPRPKIIVAIILLVTVSLTLASTIIHLLTESWWFETVGFSDVFWTRITWQVIIWIATFAIYGLFLGFNYWLALYFTRDRAFRFLEGSELEPYTKKIANYITLILIFIVSLSAANTSALNWETILKYFHATSFNSVEPIYNRDIGFYLFRLPLYKDFQNWLAILFGIGLLFAVVVYILKGAVGFDWQWKTVTVNRQWQKLVTRNLKIHISFLLAAIAFIIALDFWLERYDLLSSSHGVVWGAGYTDTHARLFAYWVMSISSLVLGMFFLSAMWLRRLLLPFYGIAIYLIVLILVNGFYPDLQQQFVVEPNELAKELPYLKHNIAFTRQAYDLAKVNSTNYTVSDQLTNQDWQQNQGTINNIRLWDYRPLLSTYRQLQEIRLYYQFNDVDVDRYTLDGNYRQVMLAPRELSYAQVPQQAQTWVNERLKYTHGYGLVMSPVNQFTPDGLPVLFIKNIPPVSEVDLQIKEPAIYYGEESDRYIFTNTSTPEFDYPKGDENAFVYYEGAGGVPIPTVWHRLAYAYDLGSLKILISNYFTNTSRIHYYRQIRERVAHVAPFLQFDNDPYIAVIDGRLQWIIDAYTTSDRYPYSEPVNNSKTKLTAGRQINYIRNSVKVLVDAKDGTMEFLVVDEEDPILATYRQIFPTLFKGKDTIAPEVKAHFRYPLDLFKIQAQMFLSYHMRDPQVFYNREDLWRFAAEIYEGKRSAIEPYYLIMRLPGESQEEFVLILPFTPVNKDNMIAWMAARSDGENYGKLSLYEFPKQKLVYGPFQIEARIDQNPEISQQLTLWSQEGSRVIRGDILVIPIDGSLIYIEPVYLRAEQGQLPELKRVIVAYDKEIVMRPTLEQSLAAIFGNKEVPQPQQAPSLTGKDSTLIRSAWETYNQAQSALSQGNWTEYGRYQQELEQILRQLNQSIK
ncbi:MAG: UPF0182 family protein [Xenococcaceae cyanobacterium MO_188.B32]|nr:UPF0182 family protein [Xenococcaceae cyanobacterium MO_188.B32]